MVSFGHGETEAALLHELRDDDAAVSARHASDPAGHADAEGERWQDASGFSQYVGDHESGGGASHGARSLKATSENRSAAAATAALAWNASLARNAEHAGTADASQGAASAGHERSGSGKGDDRRPSRGGQAVHAAHAHAARAAQTAGAATAGDAKTASPAPGACRAASRNAEASRGATGSCATQAACAAADAHGGRGLEQFSDRHAGAFEDHGRIWNADHVLSDCARAGAASFVVSGAAELHVDQVNRTSEVSFASGGLD